MLYSVFIKLIFNKKIINSENNFILKNKPDEKKNCVQNYFF
jgi:hypothetical protein